MRHLFLAILTIPTIILLAGVFLTILTGRSPGLPTFFSFFPLIGFVVSMALVFVFPNTRQWKIAAAINAIPLAFVVLILLVFWLIGYNG